MYTSVGNVFFCKRGSTVKIEYQVFPGTGQHLAEHVGPLSPPAKVLLLLSEADERIGTNHTRLTVNGDKPIL